MVYSKILYTLTGLLGTVIADDGVPVPILKSDFKKGDSPAQWAKGYPKQWGSEDFRIEGFGVVTDDEKYAVTYNRTHASFFDLDGSTKTPVSVLDLEVPQDYGADHLTVLAAPQGGYDLFVSIYRFDPWQWMFNQRRVSNDLKPVGEMGPYKVDRAVSFSKDGAVATRAGYIFNAHDPAVKIPLKGAAREVYGAGFTSDGKYVTTSGNPAAALFNATSGEKLLEYPKLPDQANWLGTAISPDDKYVWVYTDGTPWDRFYSLANLTAEPISSPNIAGPIQWSPDGKYVAVSGYSKIQVVKFPEGDVVQTWEAEYIPDPPYMRYSADVLSWTKDG